MSQPLLPQLTFGKVTEKVMENLEERVMLGVPKFFSLYPYVAGDPNPVTAE